MQERRSWRLPAFTYPFLAAAAVACASPEAVATSPAGNSGENQTGSSILVSVQPEDPYLNLTATPTTPEPRPTATPVPIGGNLAETFKGNDEILGIVDRIIAGEATEEEILKFNKEAALTIVEDCPPGSVAELRTFYAYRDGGVPVRIGPRPDAPIIGYWPSGTVVNGVCATNGVDEEGEKVGYRLATGADITGYAYPQGNLSDTLVARVPRPANTSTPFRQAEATPKPQVVETPNSVPIKETIYFEDGLNRDLAQGFIDRINLARQGLGLADLKLDARLMAAAEKYAGFLHNNISSTGACGGSEQEALMQSGKDCHWVGGSPSERAEREGYFGGASEVIMGVYSRRYSNPPATQILQRMQQATTYADFGLLTSPPHRAALLSGNFNLIGVGCYQGKEEKASQELGYSHFAVICVGDLGRN